MADETLSDETLSQDEIDDLLEGAEIISDGEEGGQDDDIDFFSGGEIEQATEKSSVSTEAPSAVKSAKDSKESASSAPSTNKNIQLLLDIYMGVTVELGRTNMKLKEILGLGEGSIIELEKPASEPVDLLVNDRLVAKGEVVVIDENFGVRVLEIIDPKKRLMQMKS